MSRLLTDTELASRAAEAIHPLLRGHPPQVQGVALADLLSIWLAGHVVVGSPLETAKVREDVLALHIEAARKLVPINFKIYIEPKIKN